MGIDEVFLQAIFENPDDETPRLIYADWLEERGDPRGQFIQVECALEKLGPDDPLRRELEVQREALAFEHEEEWFGPLVRLISVGPDGGGWVRSRRGFPHLLCVFAETFLRHAEEIFRLAPVRELALLRAGPHVRALAACVQLTRLSSLDVVGARMGDEGARLFAASPHLRGLRALNLSTNNIGPAGARALAGSRYLASLQELRLRDNHVGDVGAQAFASSPHLGELTLLDLIGNGVDRRRKPARALRERYGERVLM